MSATDNAAVPEYILGLFSARCQEEWVESQSRLVKAATVELRRAVAINCRLHVQEQEDKRMNLQIQHTTPARTRMLSRNARAQSWRGGSLVGTLQALAPTPAAMTGLPPLTARKHLRNGHDGGDFIGHAAVARARVAGCDAGVGRLHTVYSQLHAPMAGQDRRAGAAARVRRARSPRAFPRS